MVDDLMRLTINGKMVLVATGGARTLLSALRDDVRVLSPKRGCNQGVCGSCTVLIDGEPRRACLTLVERCEGHDIRTVEGLGDDATMRALQDAIIVSGGVQCGFCTPGVLISACALLRETPAPDAQEVKAALSGNICRCTGYRTIVEAVLTAAKEIAS
jgi:aerobic-type carbon monoxide dehydrogenase small subunit (CoxS/CutS family)